MTTDHAAYMREWRKRNPMAVRAIDQRYREAHRARKHKTSGTCGDCGQGTFNQARFCSICWPNHRSRPFIDRLLEKISVGPSCWLWTGAQARGYGILQRGRRGEGRVQAHRAVFEFFVGPIPEGHELDHLCRTKRCVRPSHLEPVTHAENMRRSRTDTAMR